MRESKPVFPPVSGNPLTQLRASDIRGIAQLLIQATAGATRITEGVHQSVRSTLGIPGGKQAGRTRGITGLVYKSVHVVTRLLGKGVDTVLAGLQPLVDARQGARPETVHREAVLAALNGMMGDQLVANDNPLATPMALRYRGVVLDRQVLPGIADVTGKILLLIHGLCMSDTQWQRAHDGQVVDHGGTLALSLGYTPVYLRYNSGLHTSQNGRKLAARLEQLLAHWPTRVEELTVVAHSMGGLLIRSACHYARQESLQWPDQLKSIVFLGTPHQGAPLERAGSWVDSILGSTPYTAPFARLGQLRSAGITDLRYGHVLDQDWHGHDRFERQPDRRLPVPLPAGTACYAIAATVAAKRGALADRLIGDGLVPVHSALGIHNDTRRSLAFAEASQWIAYRTNHMALLSSPEVAARMVRWLTPTGC